MNQRRRVTAVALGIAWLAALVVVVVTAAATRSDRVGTHDSAGLGIVALTLPAILLATWRLRSPVIGPLTFVVAAALSCDLAWVVLHDQSSTAAVGVAGIGIDATLIVVIGLVIQAVARAGQQH